MPLLAYKDSWKRIATAPSSSASPVAKAPPARRPSLHQPRRQTIPTPPRPQPAAEKAPTKPLDGSWEDGGVKYSFKGGAASTTITSEDGLTLVFDTAPKGTHYKLGDKSGTIDSADTVVDVPFPAPLDKIPVSGAVSMGAKIDPKMSAPPRTSSPTDAAATSRSSPSMSGEARPLDPQEERRQGAGVPQRGDRPGAEGQPDLPPARRRALAGKNGDLGGVDFIAVGHPHAGDEGHEAPASSPTSRRARPSR